MFASPFVLIKNTFLFCFEGRVVCCFVVHLQKRILKDGLGVSLPFILCVSFGFVSYVLVLRACACVSCSLGFGFWFSGVWCVYGCVWSGGVTPPMLRWWYASCCIAGLKPGKRRRGQSLFIMKLCGHLIFLWLMIVPITCSICRTRVCSWFLAFPFLPLRVPFPFSVIFLWQCSYILVAIHTHLVYGVQEI